MLKFVTALSAALIIGWALVGSATTASAGGYGYRHHGSGHHRCCGPIRPSYSVSTRYVHKHIRHNRDVWRTKHVKRIKRYVHVTRIQPIYHVHNVTRVHTKIVGVVVPVHVRKTHYLPPKRIVTSSTVYLRPQCACSSSGYGRY
jgi:hypothetical protein